MKKLKVLLFALVICSIGIISPQKSFAAGWLTIKATPVSQTKVTLSWKKKNVKQYKVYRTEVLKNGNSRKAKLLATLSGSKRSFTDRSVKKNTDYTYRIEGYKKTGKSMKRVWFGDASTYTGWLPPAWDEYIESDYPLSTKQITLVFGESTGIQSSCYKIYRRESGEKSYKAIKTIQCKKNKYYYTFTDTSVKPGKSYYYKVRSQHKLGKKKEYSKFSTPLNMSAVNRNGVYDVLLLTKPKNHLSELVFKITSRDGNGDLVLTEDNRFESDSQNMMYNDEPIGLHPKQYSTDGKSWKTVTPNTKIVIKAKETIYLRLKTADGIYISSLDPNSSLTVSDCKYNRLTSFFTISFNNSTAKTSLNSEYIH